MVRLKNTGFRSSTRDLIIKEWRGHPIFKRYESLLYDTEDLDFRAMVAAHEAAHVIAAEALGWRSSYVTIDCEWGDCDGFYEVEETTGRLGSRGY
jgi:hypothetical protein